MSRAKKHPSAPVSWRAAACLMAFLLLAWTRGAAWPGGEEKDEPKLGSPSWTAQIAALSRYLWRGIPLSDGFVLQPSAEAEWQGWFVEGWANFDLGSAGDLKGFNEFDITLGYSQEWPWLTVEPGLNFFSYPRRSRVDPPTIEAFLAAAVPLAGPVAVFLDQALDFGAYPGAYYAEAGLSLEVEMQPALRLETSLSQSFASKSFNAAYWDVSRADFNAVSLRASLTWSWARGFFLRPRVEAVLLTSRLIREPAGRRSYFSFGLALGLEK